MSAAAQYTGEGALDFGTGSGAGTLTRFTVCNHGLWMIPDPCRWLLAGWYTVERMQPSCHGRDS